MLVKTKKVWSCNECGHSQSKWAGKCPLCKEWNTLHEEMQTTTRFESAPKVSQKPIKISEVTESKTPRMPTNSNELDRLLGGGLVPGSLTLIGGHPGIGKSTLMMQLAEAMAKQGLVVLYVSGEESVEQTSLRAKRLGVTSDNIYLYAETCYTNIRCQVDNIKPDILIIDSIQIVYKSEVTSAPGSVSQVRECTSEFMHLAKGKNIATFLIGHVTKSGEIAGPKILEHLVDTVLYFQGDKQHNYRMVRVEKNRFGPTDEIAVFQMHSSGLVEIPNPSQIFLEERKKEVLGSVVVPTVEGSRPIMVELQALVSKTAYQNPARRCAGIDSNRLALLLAVLEKGLGYPLYTCDVFVSVAGGLKIHEPAIDLGIILAIASSFTNTQIDPTTTVVGEVGLSGEIRSVPRLDGRIKESVLLGFKRILIPKFQHKDLEKEFGKDIELIPIEMVDQAIRGLLQNRR